MQKDEDSVGSHVFRAVNCLEPNEGDLHGKKGAQNVENAVAYVNSGVDFSDDEQEHHEDWDDVDDECVASPSRNHVKVSQRGESSPK